MSIDASSSSSPTDANLVADLQSQLNSFQARVKELEAENQKLSSRLSNCHCNHEMESKQNGSDVCECEDICVEESKKSKRGTKKMDKETVNNPGCDIQIINHHCRRYVALKVMYFGKRYYGFASEAQMDPTVESEIFKAFGRTRLLVGDKKESKYTRCGRTDRGVSSIGQVISIFLRSKLKGFEPNCGRSAEVFLDDELEKEIDYVKVLNRVLPNDIRILGWCPVPVDFSARFSCLSRNYKYFFWDRNLDILAMESAGKKFLGEHDFRNFCKMDAANVHNYRRCISSFGISSTDVRYNGYQLWAIKIRGTAFLWHQVRCMVGVLFMIGQGLESPDVIDMLLDTDTIPRKPQYKMAPEIPLVLDSCEFEGLKFTCSSEARETLQMHLENECRAYQLQAAIFHDALMNCLPGSKVTPIPVEKPISNGTDRKKGSHIPLMSRQTEPSYEERRAKFR